MKTLIFSDTHLGLRFNKKKLFFLKKLIKKADRIVINGDFWEGFEMKFDDFVKSPWKELFPLLKKKNTIYVYGNHDDRKFSNGHSKLFSQLQTDQYRLEVGGKTFVIEHGHKQVPMIDVIFFKEILGIKPPQVFNGMFENIEKFCVKLFGKRFLKLAYSRFNEIIKKKIKKQRKNGEIFIFGHTHYPEVDHETGFINHGFIKHGLASYLMIDNKGDFQLKEEKYA